MSKLRIRLDGSHSERLSKCRAIITRLTNNSFFPEPWTGSGLSVAICTAILDEYDGDILAASRGDRDNIAKRNEMFPKVKAMMEKLAHYVEMVAGDNMEALRSSGFELRREAVKKPVSKPIPEESDQEYPSVPA